MLEDHVDAVVGEGEHPLREVVAVGDDHLVHTEVGQHLAHRLAPRRADDRGGAHRLGHLHAHEPHTRTRAGDQHGTALHEVGGDERAVLGEQAHGQGRRLDRRDRGRTWHRESCIDQDVVGVRRRHGPHDGVSDAPGAHPVTDGGDLTGVLEPGHRLLAVAARGGVGAVDHGDVAVVRRRGVDAHEHLTGAGAGDVALHQFPGRAVADHERAHGLRQLCRSVLLSHPQPFVFVVFVRSS